MLMMKPKLYLCAKARHETQGRFATGAKAPGTLTDH